MTPTTDLIQTTQIDPKRICAHRGLSHCCPENTLPAFGAAIALGVAEVEFDLWLSADGVPVVSHDPTVDRTTTGYGLIKNLTWSQIGRLDAGVRFDEPWSGVRIPSFPEVVSCVGGRAKMNIHLKEAGPKGELVRIVADYLRDHDLLDMAYLAGESDVLEVALEHAPHLSRACLSSQNDPMKMIAAAKRYRCSRVQFYRKYFSPEHIVAAHEAELVCNFFWSDDPVEAREYLNQGVDIMLTNCAHQFLSIPPESTSG